MIHARRKSSQRPDVDLGLAIAECHARRGYSMPHETIAAFTGLTMQRVHQIEDGALRRIRWSPKLKALKEYRS